MKQLSSANGITITILHDFPISPKHRRNNKFLSTTQQSDLPRALVVVANDTRTGLQHS